MPALSAPINLTFMMLMLMKSWLPTLMSSDDGTLVHGDMAPDHPPDTNEDAAEDPALLAHATKIAPTSPGDHQ